MARSVDLEGDFEVLVDAQRGEFYRARYRRSGAGIEQLLGLELVSRDGVSGDLPRFSPEPEKLGSGVSALFPDAEALAKLAMEAKPAPAEELAPIYLRPVEFRKAPPPRSLG
jgi:tRNA A37 threonylcarbamoyladenosine modification protein TsaB